MVLEQNKTYVGKLLVRSAASEALSLQLRLRQALASVDLHPTGLPSSAIVFIRKLHDPAPGSLRIQDAHVPTEWARAVAASISQIVRRAARPALEHVDTDVDAVLFANRAELIACLAADWCHGMAITRWWWQSLFRATDVSSAVVREWLTSIESVPAAFAKLAQRQLATPFAIAFPASATHKLLDELIRHFGLAELSQVLPALRNAKQAPAIGAPYLDEKPRSKPPELLSSNEVMQLRVLVAPDAFAPRLELDARVLLAAALMLERAPTLLRERSFASRFLPTLLALHTPEASVEVEATEQSQRTVGQTPDLPEARALGLPLHLITSPLAGDRARESLSIIETQRSDDGVEHDVLNARPEDLSAPNSAGIAVDVPEARANPSLSIAEAQRSDYRVQQDGLNARLENLSDTPKPAGTEGISRSKQSSLAIAEGRAPIVKAIPIPEAKVTGTAVELGIETKLGGVFYLISAALALGLYGDFTTPLKPGIELSVWDFLALIGRKLAGKQIEHDPIWSVLAKLAGRGEGELPGARFKPPGQLRMPPDWLKAFPEWERWCYSISRGRLVVRHPAGFNVLDVKLGPHFRITNLKAMLARETRRYSHVGGFKRRRLPLPKLKLRERRLDRWIQWMADYLRARVARSLGSGPAQDLTPFVFLRTARVEVTPARLDVFFSLAELPVEIRLAGLDRDPGWVPAAGRTITFHYD